MPELERAPDPWVQTAAGLVRVANVAAIWVDFTPAADWLITLELTTGHRVRLDSCTTQADARKEAEKLMRLLGGQMWWS